MNVGIPKELLQHELRVAATPKTVVRLKKQGFEVLVESGCGVRAKFSDEEGVDIHAPRRDDPDADAGPKT